MTMVGYSLSPRAQRGVSSARFVQIPRLRLGMTGGCLRSEEPATPSAARDLLARLVPTPRLRLGMTKLLLAKTFSLLQKQPCHSERREESRPFEAEGRQFGVYLLCGAKFLFYRAQCGFIFWGIQPFQPHNQRVFGVVVILGADGNGAEAKLFVEFLGWSIAYAHF